MAKATNQYYSPFEGNVFIGAESYDEICDKIYIEPGKKYSFFPYISAYGEKLIDIVKHKAIKKRVSLTVAMIFTFASVLMVDLLMFSGTGARIIVLACIGTEIADIIFFIKNFKLRICKELGRHIKNDRQDIINSFNALLESDEKTDLANYKKAYYLDKIFDLSKCREAKIFYLSRLSDGFSYLWHFETDELVVDGYIPLLIRYFLTVFKFNPDRLGTLSYVYLARYADKFAADFPDESYTANAAIRQRFEEEFTAKAIECLNVSKPPINRAYKDDFDPKSKCLNRDYVIVNGLVNEDYVIEKRGRISVIDSNLRAMYDDFLKSIVSVQCEPATPGVLTAVPEQSVATPAV